MSGRYAVVLAPGSLDLGSGRDFDAWLRDLEAALEAAPEDAAEVELPGPQGESLRAVALP